MTSAEAFSEPSYLVCESSLLIGATLNAMIPGVAEAHRMSSAKALFFSFSEPHGTSATPKRPVRVGNTLSNMSAPSAEQTTISMGYLRKWHLGIHC